MLCLVYEVEEYIITLTVFFFFFKEKPRISEGEAAEDHPYPCCFLETDPSSSLNSGANLHFHSVLSKTIYSMENRHSRQNKRETTSEGEVECSAIYDRTNYHIWSLFSRKSDGLMQLDPSLKDNFVLCNRAFSDTRGNSKCSFILLSFSCHVLFDYIFFHTATIFLPFQI